MMAVYVDDFEARLGGMKLSHMIADTAEELHAMADKIGINRKWIQKPGTRFEHYDISQAKRKLAIKYGAIPVSSRELGQILRRKHSMANSEAT